MNDLLQIMIYPIKQIALLLFSLTIDGVSVGALIVAAVALAIIFRLFVGQHLSALMPDFLDSQRNTISNWRGSRRRDLAVGDSNQPRLGKPKE